MVCYGIFWSGQFFNERNQCVPVILLPHVDTSIVRYLYSQVSILRLIIKKGPSRIVKLQLLQIASCFTQILACSRF